MRGFKYELQPIRIASEKEWAWAAGVYEGEGGVNSMGNIQISITQKDPYILHQLRQFTGGSVKPNHCKTSFGDGRRHRLLISGPNARSFVNHVWKWLSPRRQDQLVAFAEEI